MRRVYRLTPAEADLAVALVAGTTITAYADEDRISVQTARGYLKSTLRKTETHRQTDLVRLLLTSPGPLLHKHSVSGRSTLSPPPWGWRV